MATAQQRKVRRRQGLRALEAIRGIRDQVDARTGPQPDSVPLIRALREEGRPSNVLGAYLGAPASPPAHRMAP